MFHDRNRLQRPAAEIECFWSHVDLNGPIPLKWPELGPCWLWTGGQRGKGYGSFNYRRDDGRQRPANAHRYIYEVTTEIVASGLVVDHLCEVRLCVNPAHLEPVTNRENVSRGWWIQERRAATHCVHGHEFTAENTRLTKNGQRICRTCQRAAGIAYKARLAKRAA